MMSKNKNDKSYAKFHISMDDSGTEVDIEGLGLNILNMLASSALKHESVFEILDRVMSAVKKRKQMKTLTDMCDYHKNILEASTKALLSATVKETINMAMDKKKTSELVSMLTETMAQSYTSGEIPDHTELIVVAVMDVLNRASSIAESTIEKKHGRQAKKADNEG